MSEDESAAKEKRIITAFEKEIVWRKESPSKEIRLAELKDFYETLMEYLPVSEAAKKYLHNKIIDAQKVRRSSQ